MVDKDVIIKLVEELDKYYVMDGTEYESFIHNMIYDDHEQDPEGSFIMDSSHHFSIGVTLKFFAKLGLDVFKEVNSRDDLLFAQINKSLKNSEVFTELVEKEFDFVDPSMEQAERRLEEYIEKHRKELEDGEMA
jgi:hypothetical protein